MERAVTVAMGLALDPGAQNVLPLQIPASREAVRDRPAASAGSTTP